MIRRAMDKDVKDILNLLVQVCMVHHNGRPDLFNGPATKYTEKELLVLFRDDERPVFVFVGEDGHVKGHAFCMHKQFVNDNVMTDIKTLYIDDICVDENARGQGIASRLYEFILDYARAHGCYNVTLNVWTCNPGAMKFYEKCGMKQQKIGMETIL